MPIGLHARFHIDPRSVLDSRWVHDMANVMCRAKLKIEVDFLEAKQAGR